MKLIYSIITAHIQCNEKRHAQVVMDDLGITYEKAVPQSLFDAWEFYGCKNVPEELPKYLRVSKYD